MERISAEIKHRQASFKEKETNTWIFPNKLKRAAEQEDEPAGITAGKYPEDSSILSQRLLMDAMKSESELQRTNCKRKGTTSQSLSVRMN